MAAVEHVSELERVDGLGCVDELEPCRFVSDEYGIWQITHTGRIFVQRVSIHDVRVR